MLALQYYLLLNHNTNNIHYLNIRYGTSDLPYKVEFVLSVSVL